MSKIFKMLCIDGGGIKGLYSSKILEHLEDKIEGNISDYFDMICGTSTGGLIALGLSLNISTPEISAIYEKNGEKIFPELGKGKSKFKQYASGGKYTDVELKKVLENIFGNKKLKNCNNILCIPSYSLTDGRPWIFKFGHRKEMNRTRDDETLCIDVALATSAAPTYLPVAEIDSYDNRQFIDGGIFANDPSMVGFTEAMSFFVGENNEYDELHILSISSLNSSVGEKTGSKRNRSLWDWGEDLFNSILNSQAKFIEYFMSQIKNFNSVPVTYVRIPSEILSSSQDELISLDNSSKEAIDLIKGKGNDAGEIWKKKEEIKQFFKNKKTYKV